MFVIWRSRSFQGGRVQSPEHALLRAVLGVTSTHLMTGQSLILHSFSMAQRPFKEDVD